MEHSAPTRPPWLSRKIGYFFIVSRAGRKLTLLTHGRLYHRSWKYHPLSFSGTSCWLCRLVWREMASAMPPFPDQSSIKLSEPVYDEHGALMKRGVHITATAQRQLEALMADPEKGAAAQAAIDEIARDTKP